MTPLDLAIRKDNDSCKCRNCTKWTRIPQTDAIGRCALGDCIMPDLAVCTAWERAADPVIEVRQVKSNDAA